MNIRLHQRARTIPAIRAELQTSMFSERMLARQYGITHATVRKWRGRTTVEGWLSHHAPAVDLPDLSPGSHRRVFA